VTDGLNRFERNSISRKRLSLQRSIFAQNVVQLRHRVRDDFVGQGSSELLSFSQLFEDHLAESSFRPSLSLKSEAGANARVNRRHRRGRALARARGGVRLNELFGVNCLLVNVFNIWFPFVEYICKKCRKNKLNDQGWSCPADCEEQNA